MHRLLSDPDDRIMNMEIDERSFNELSIDEQVEWLYERDYG